MLNTETIKQIANENRTSKVVFNALGERIRFRRQTNLNKFQNDLLLGGQRIDNEEYFNLFRKLEQMGAGSIIFGRRGNPTRFAWHYNLKDIAKAAVSDVVQFHKLGVSEPKKRGRPAKKIENKLDKPVTITINLTSDMSKEFILALTNICAQLNKVA